MAAYVDDPAEFRFILERGYITLDGQQADLVDAADPNLCDPESGFMRFEFREPFRRGGLRLATNSPYAWSDDVEIPRIVGVAA